MFVIHFGLFILLSHGFCLALPFDPDVGIIGGHDISIEDVPYMASLRIDGTRHFCGGSIIHERFILSAAHCIHANRTYKVMVGTAKIHQGGELFDVEKIIVHHEYVPKIYDYDISIIKLNKPLTFGPKVNKLALNHKIIKMKKGMTFNSTGWGYTQPKGNISETLRQVQVDFVQPKICQLYYSKNLVPITPRMLCAGGKGKDSCQGDSGGPLTMEGIQIGITSFGAGCGVLPGIYTKVSKLSTWITRTITQNL